MSPHEDELVGIIPALRAYARFLTRSASRADDLVQDTLERAIRRRDTFIAGSSLKTWVFSILRNKFLDDLRSGRRIVEDSKGGYAATLVSLPSQIWRMQILDFSAAIEALEPKTREAVLLVMVGGLTHEEAATVADCPVGTLKSRIRRARSILMEAVDLPSMNPIED